MFHERRANKMMDPRATEDRKVSDGKVSADERKVAVTAPSPAKASSSSSDVINPLSSAPRCRYFDSNAGCSKGDACPFQHLPPVMKEKVVSKEATKKATATDEIKKERERLAAAEKEATKKTNATDLMKKERERFAAAEKEATKKAIAADEIKREREREISCC